MNIRTLLFAAFLTGVSVQGANLVSNGGFESGTNGWHFWSREKNAGGMTLETKTVHTGKNAMHIEHRGEADWSVEPQTRLEVKAGDMLELTCWLKVSGNGNAVLCAATYDAKGQAVQWSQGAQTVGENNAWQPVKARFVVPPGVTQVQPRLIGHGKVSVWLDDYAAAVTGNLLALRPANLPPVLNFKNAALEATFNTTECTLTVLDRKAGRRWTQKPFSQEGILKNVAIKDGKLQAVIFHGATGLDLALTMELDGDKPEILVQVSAQGDLPGSIQFPHPFTGEPGDYLVVPMNEGISYPVDDKTISPLHLIAYGGHGICMAFYGVTDGVKGQMAIIETADDASIRIDRREGRLLIVPEWDPQLRKFGYTRKLRYVFFDQGGHVAMAKRYRAYAKQTGLLQTLAEKRQTNPNVDLLIGAVNVWCWDKDSVEIARDMQAAGIDRILWSNRQSAEKIKAMNDMGILTSRYDIYQDAMNPENFPRLRYIHGDWTTNAYPKDIIVDARGRFQKGWEVETKDGAMIPCGVICDKRAPDYARERIPAELRTSPYRGRFIDTTTAAPWHECYSPVHPMTRTESKKWKMELLRYVNEDNNLVTGCETGHDASVPFLHFYEGMMSLGPYRVPDSGRRMQEIWTNAPEKVVKFQLGHDYRLPLWELVYHDCVVAQWYWGDYNNKLPMLWDKRDLFNALYGTGTMFMFNRSLWEKNKARFVQSYKNTCPAIRKVGYQEMTDHRFLTKDRAVQQTVFANGIKITVNFGAAPFKLPNGTLLQPMGYDVTER